MKIKTLSRLILAAALTVPFATNAGDMDRPAPIHAMKKMERPGEAPRVLRIQLSQKDLEAGRKVPQMLMKKLRMQLMRQGLKPRDAQLKKLMSRLYKEIDGQAGQAGLIVIDFYCCGWHIRIEIGRR